MLYKPKKYILDMFPYPSGDGLHVGHVEGYTASDIYSRYLRMKGYHVLHPMGWDAFGLPAENYAIKNKIHPALIVKKNVKIFKKQLQNLGFAYDWDREINTTDPEYYRWTQWIFLKLFEHGLAYEAEAPINWCPSCKTGLANEEVIDGECERCGTKISQKKLRQWLLKITAYADRLLKDLETLDWPEKIKIMQRNWIGRSQGAEIEFKIQKSKIKIKVFTTRADTLFGATYVVLAPEHELISKVKNQKSKLQFKIQNWKEVKIYIKQAGKKSELQRTDLTKEKTGVELKGIKAINPANKEEIPIFIADYVLASYGTGAIMAVPAHDQRDFEFAKKFNLPIKIVICPNYPDKTCPILEKAYEGEGYLVGSNKFNGLKSEDAKRKITKFVGGKEKITYKLRDWVFSRQRYWGEPIPLVFCEHCADKIKNQKSKVKINEYNKGELENPGWIAVTEKDLPVKLPNVKYYQPTGTGESPLAKMENWVKTKCPKCGGPAKRETNTMPQWAGSNWYYLAYILNENLKAKSAKIFWDKNLLKYWLPVDIYVGGVEHAVLHLLYARFWHKFLYDLKIVPTKEPFQKLINQGLILGPDHQKMSKSRGNIVNPENIIKKFGADSLRMYEMFMGPLEDVKPWDSKGIVGIYRFLNKVYNLILNYQHKSASNKSATISVVKLLHKTIKKVTEDIENFKFNTAIAALMILVNEMEKAAKLQKKDLEVLLKLLAPFAPRLAEELWHLLGNPISKSVHLEKWPEYDKKLIVEDKFTLIIQINGKIRDKFEAPLNISEKEAKDLTLKRDIVKRWIDGKTARKIIFVPNRLINIVI